MEDKAGYYLRKDGTLTQPVSLLLVQFLSRSTNLRWNVHFLITHSSLATAINQPAWAPQQSYWKDKKKKKRPGFSVNNDLLIANSLFILVLDVQRERIKGHVNEKKRGLFRAVAKPSRLLPAFINPAALWKSGAQKRSSGKVLACHLEDKKLSTCQLFGLTINLAILPSQPTFLLRRLQFGEGKKKTTFPKFAFCLCARTFQFARHWTWPKY